MVSLRGWAWRRIVPAVVVVGVLAGCAKTINGTAKMAGAIDPGTVAGLAVTSGPTGLRQGVGDAQVSIANTDGAEYDRLAANALADIQEYWTQRFPAEFDGKQFEPVKKLVSFDSTSSSSIQVCQQKTSGFVNAVYCSLDDSISWDRGELLPALARSFGQISVVTVLAHEMGHAVQRKLGPAAHLTQATRTVVLEQQADCYAGAFLRWVAEGKAKHFQLSTGAGLNDAMRTLFSVRDAPGQDAARRGAHGSAFDRVASFQFGFTDGPKRCNQMDEKEIQERITELPFDAKDADKGQAPINDSILGAVTKSLTDSFAGAKVPAPEIRKGDSGCPDGTSTSPATYCAANNTVLLNMAALTEIGTAPRRGEQKPKGIGPFAAFAELASRYALSVQKGVGLPLEGAATGLRTACFVGAWTGLTMAHPPGGRAHVQGVVLSPGDLDMAVAELLGEGSLIAADVKGGKVPAGFARVEAFRMGFLEGSDPCNNRF